RVLTYLAITFTILLAGTFILSKVDTGWGYEYIPYEENEYVEHHEPKYVFLIILDATRFDWLSTEGYDIETPNLQSLADDGIYYANTIANSYWTKPTMASLFTSVLPKDHRTNYYTTPLNEELPVLAEQFRNMGYYSIGVTNNPNLKTPQKYHRGFNNYTFLARGTLLPFVQQGPLLNRLAFTKRILSHRLYGNLPVFASGKATTEYSVNTIDYYRNNPLFAYIHYMDPHGPYYEHPYNGKSRHPRVEFTPEDSLERVTNLYKGELEYTDKWLGELIGYMKHSGIYDSSLIVLTADHGEEFFEHFCWSHIIALWDELIHVPLIIKPPFYENGGKVDTSLVQHLDIAPTMVEYAGGKPPDGWQGDNIFSPGYHNSSVISQCDGIYSIRSHKYKIMNTIPDYAEIRLSAPEFSHIDKRAVFPEENVFNLIDDPHEKNNLAETERGRQIMDSLIAASGVEELMIIPDVITEGGIELDEETIEQLKAIGYLD
ncbi:MAG: sulfatase-like hydrolase/transferase, partial [candidate division Zixibacteria bacterium]|nr:sulfatase-like hydrolase/transferase [candidate division Zixibacteria bacterium]